MANAASGITVTTAAAASGVWPQPLISSSTTRNSAAVSAADSSASDTFAASAGRPAGVDAGAGFAERRGISASAASASGTCTKKIACQLIASVSTPPTAGPAAAPSPPAAAHTPTARFSEPATVESSSSAAHTAAAPPTAWPARETSSQVKSGASAQPSEAAANSSRPAEQTTPGANRRDRYAAGTATTASTRLKSVSTHATWSIETLK